MKMLRRSMFAAVAAMPLALGAVTAAHVSVNPFWFTDRKPNWTSDIHVKIHSGLLSGLRGILDITPIQTIE